MLMLRGAFSHLAFSARSPAKCTGPRTERDSFPFKIPYSRRVLFWLCTFRFFFFLTCIKQCNIANQFIALEKHICMDSCKLFLMAPGMKSVTSFKKKKNVLPKAQN